MPSSTIEAKPVIARQDICDICGIDCRLGISHSRRKRESKYRANHRGFCDIHIEVPSFGFVLHRTTRPSVTAFSKCDNSFRQTVK
jgi:hypothetical protein